MDSPITHLANLLGRPWPTLTTCMRKAEELRSNLAKATTDLVPADCALIVFGSLARNETTTNSDLDWTLVVDGSADPQHVQAAQTIGQRVHDLGIKRPGGAGLFGGSVTISSTR